MGSNEELVTRLLEQQRLRAAATRPQGRRVGQPRDALPRTENVGLGGFNDGGRELQRGASPLAISGLRDDQVSRIQQLLQEHEVKRDSTESGT